MSRSQYRKLPKPIGPFELRIYSDDNAQTAPVTTNPKTEGNPTASDPHHPRAQRHSSAVPRYATKASSYVSALEGSRFHDVLEADILKKSKGSSQNVASVLICPVTPANRALEH